MILAQRLGRMGDPRRPRAILIRFRDEQTRDRVLQASRNQPMKRDGRDILLFPDLPPQIGARRRKFASVKKRLSDAGARTGFLFPAILISTLNGETKRFDDPEKAAEWANGKLGREKAVEIM